MSVAQAGLLRAAGRHLGAGRVREALAAARQLVDQVPHSADARHMLAICLAEDDDAFGAENAFQHARSLAPDDAGIASNFVAWLRRQGRLQDAMDVLASLPKSAAVLSALGMIALQCGDHVRACAALTEATRLQPDATAAWHGLGNALRGLGRLEEAVAAYRKATELSPRGVAGWFGLGVALRLLGRVEEALACLRRAESLGPAVPELQDAINGVLHDAGRPAEALQGARQLVAAQPGFVPGQQTLAHLLWENGDPQTPDEDPLGMFRQAAARMPAERDLQLGYLRMLFSAGRPQEALDWLQPLRHRDPADPVLGWFQANALDALGERQAAARLYLALDAKLGDDPAFLNARARNAFRTGMPELAQSCAQRAVELDPRDQEAWSHLGTAWRVLGDPREMWLFDYERLVGFVDVSPPDNHLDGQVFLATLASTLESLHLARREPINQSVRSGTQTGGRLFGRPDPVILDLERALRAAIESWLKRLRRDPRHPFLAWLQPRVRFVGSWSVRLTSSGRHANHIHGEGWLSSAYYVALPPAVTRGRDHAGWIQFGRPMDELGLDLPPRLLLQPAEGKLALFPSYIWHGTLPFEDCAPRLTVAFDMQPSG